VQLSDDDPEYYKGGFTESELNKWIGSRRFSLFPELSAGNLRQYTGGFTLTVIGAVDPSDSKTEEFLQLMRRVAKDNKGKFGFAHINGVEYSKFVKNFGVSSMPSFFVYRAEDQSYAANSIEGQITEGKMTSFLNDVQSGKVALQSGTGLVAFMKNYWIWIVAGVAAFCMVIALIAWCTLEEDEKQPPDGKKSTAANDKSTKQD